jgi:hypothetical protein
VTRAKISQYSATANDNTDVNGVDIAEGCPPSSMNNMGREIMAALKRFQVGSDGDGVTVGGALVVSGATTANTISATIVNASGNATVGGTLVVTGATTFSGNVILSGTTTANTFSTDLITEKTSAAGVTIDGVLLKDNGVVTGAGTVSAPVYSTTGDLNTGIFFPAADTIAFAEGGAEAMRIDSSGNVGIGVTPSAWSGSVKAMQIGAGGSLMGAGADLYLGNNYYFNGSNNIYISNGTATQYAMSGGQHKFYTASSGTAGNAISFTQAMTLDSSGNLLVGKTASNAATAGSELRAAGVAVHTCSGDQPLIVNRLANDGVLVEFRQDNTAEGNISVSGTTVSYNGGHLSRWAQMLTKPDLLKGTVMSNLDEMNVYIAPTTYWTEEDELPVNEDGNPTVAVGDVKQETSVSENEQLNKVKVSDVEGDANVAGVFVNWEYDKHHQVDEINMAMTGDMIIRIAQGTTVARGDLLMSAGDGTAKPQGDDIVRSKTIAKVTSTHVTCTYDDGSYCVPCVLMAC